MIDPESAEEMIWKQLPGGYCAVMHESWWLLLLNVGLLLCGACLEIFYLCKSGRPNVSRPLGRLQQAGNGLLDAECGEGRDVISLELGCVAAAPNGFEVATAQAEVFIPLPMQIVGEANVQVPWNWDTVAGAFGSEGVTSVLSRVWRRCRLEAHGYSFQRKDMGCGASIAPEAASSCLSGDGQPQGPPEGSGIPPAQNASEALFLVPRELSSVSPRSRYQTSPTVLMGTEEYGQRGLASKPQEFFVELLAHSDLTASEEMWSVLELGTFTLHDLILAAKDAARDKKLHCLQKEEQGCQLTRALHHITAALAFLHSRFFVHGDLKPQNVMWFETLGRWKLIDMDGLRVPSELVDMRDADFYTAIYAAPELAAAVAEEGPLRLSRSLDIWAGGLCVLEMKLFKPLLQEKFEHFCTASADGEGLMDFFRWLGSVDDPIEETSALHHERPKKVLLRIIESLSEHALHAPEYLAMIFHQLRWAQPNDDRTAMLREATSFTLDCDLLHAGVDEMRKNTNPFTGGINFDETWHWHLRCWSEIVMALLDATLLVSLGRERGREPRGVLAELGLLWHGLSQRRLCRSPGRFKSRVKRAHRLWTRRRFMSLIVGVVSLGAMVVVGQDGTNSAASFMTVVSDPPIGPIGKEGKGSAPFFVWLFVLLLCFAFEVIFVAPLVSGFSFSGFCARSPDLPLEGPGGLADGVRPGLTAPLGWCCERTWLESLPTIARSPRVKVTSAVQHTELMQVLDDRLIATTDVPGSGPMAKRENWRRSPQVDLQKIPAAVSERLCFFANSLRAILKSGDLRPGRDTLLDRKVGNVPTLTQVVPVYEEQVLLSEEFLCASDGRNSNLGFTISQAEDQWEIFARKQGMAPRELYNSFTCGELHEWKQKEEVDQDIRSLIWRYRQYPVFLVCDYDAELARPSLKEMVTCHAAREHNFTGRFQYASLLLAFNEHLGRHGNRKRGFAPGHYLQMMDANMGAFFGEACKVPFILQHFQPAGSDRRRVLPADRSVARTVQARIIGFREHIFTGSHGAVGAAMADAEWTFGTICQRFLAGLGARMHYGHPDFLDGFWASNRGSMSKASPVLNLSEDIFAGFNVLMRGERSTHVDCLEWEKGREVSFNSASLFFTKVASGNVGVMRSRDLKTLTGSMNIADSFSFYFASVGFYLYNVVTDISMSAYATRQTPPACHSKTGTGRQKRPWSNMAT
eukprot:g23968.t1